MRGIETSATESHAREGDTRARLCGVQRTTRGVLAVCPCGAFNCRSLGARTQSCVLAAPAIITPAIRTATCACSTRDTRYSLQVVHIGLHVHARRRVQTCPCATLMRWCCMVGSLMLVCCYMCAACSVPLQLHLRSTPSPFPSRHHRHTPT